MTMPTAMFMRCRFKSVAILLTLQKHAYEACIPHSICHAGLELHDPDVIIVGHAAPEDSRLMML